MRTVSRRRGTWVLALVASVLLSTGAAAGIAGADPDGGSTPVDEPVAASTTVGEPAPITSEPVGTTVPDGDATTEPSTTSAPAPATEPGADDDGATTTTGPGEPVAAPAEPVPAPTPAAPRAPQPGPTLLVNGQPFRGEADPKLEGCAVTLSISGLAAGAHSVSGSIRAAEPSGEGVLAEVQATFDGAEWSATYDLTAAVEGFEQHANGYRIRVTLAIDGGAPQTSRLFWLACGADQTGSPFVVVIDKRWTDPGGTPLTAPPEDLPDDWAITASSQLGTAECTYPAGSDVLVCEYENRGGHEGATDGLYVPGGKGKTFTVAESPLPEGWEQVSGIGTFVARDVCPGGGHEHDRAVRAGEEPRPPCPHVVVNRQLPAPPTTPSTSEPPAVLPTDTAGVAGAGATAGGPAADSLARTGTDLPVLLVGGVGMLVLGGLLVMARRRMTGALGTR